MYIATSASTASAILTAILGKLDAGSAGATIKLYTGTRPTDPDAALSGNALLGTLVCSATSGTVSGHTLTFNAITQDNQADATGIATWARLADSDGGAVIDVDVTATGGGGFLQLNTVSIVVDGPILVSQFVITA